MADPLYFLTQADLDKLSYMLYLLGINPGTRPLQEQPTTVHRASDTVIVKVTSTIAKRVGSTVNSASCEVWVASTWATAGYSIDVYNISDTADVVAGYYTAVMDREGEWHFAGSITATTDAITDIRIAGTDNMTFQYYKGGMWVDWHTGEACDT